MPSEPLKQIVDIPGIGEVTLSGTQDEINAKSMELYKSQQSVGSKIYDQLTSPLIPAIATAARSIANRIDAPYVGEGDWEAEVRGFLAGAVTGAGDMLAAQTSPVGIAMSLAGLGPESKLIKSIPMLQKALKTPAIKSLQRSVATLGSAAFGTEGAYDAVTAPTTEGKVLGVVQAAMGVAGGAMSNRKPVLKATRALGQGMIDAAAKPGFVRATAIGAMAGGGALGHPIAGVATGLPMMVAPNILKATGKGVMKLGGDAPNPARLPSGTRDISMMTGQGLGGRIKESLGIRPKGLNISLSDLPSSGGVGDQRIPLVGTPAEASGRVQKVMAKEAAQAARPVSMTVDEQISDAQTQADIKASDLAKKQAEETAKAESIRAARTASGVEARPASFSTTQSASTPAGREVQTTRFGPHVETPEEELARITKGGGGSSKPAPTQAELEAWKAAVRATRNAPTPETVVPTPEGDEAHLAKLAKIREGVRVNPSESNEEFAARMRAKQQQPPIRVGKPGKSKPISKVEARSQSSGARNIDLPDEKTSAPPTPPETGNPIPLTHEADNKARGSIAQGLSTEHQAEPARLTKNDLAAAGLPLDTQPTAMTAEQFLNMYKARPERQAFYRELWGQIAEAKKGIK